MGAEAAVMAGGAVLGYMGDSKRSKALDRQAEAASRPTEWDQTSTTERNPWEPSVDYRTHGMESAYNLLNTPGGSPSTYSPAHGRAYTASAQGYTAEQLAESLDLMRLFSQGGNQSPYMDESGDFYRLWAEGEANQRLNEYLDMLIPGEGKQYMGNPYLDQVIDAALRGTEERYKQGVAGLSSGAETTGRFGSGAHQLADAQAAERFAQVLGDVEGGMHFDDYNMMMSQIPGLLALDQSGRQFGVQGLTTLADMDNQMRMFGGQGLLQGEMFNVDALNEAARFLAESRNRASITNAGLRTNASLTNAGYTNAARANNARAAWEDLIDYSRVIEAMSGAYGTQTTHEQGIRTGPANISADYPDPWMGAVEGSVGAAKTYKELSDLFGWGKADSVAAPGSNSGGWFGGGGGGGGGYYDSLGNYRPGTSTGFDIGGDSHRQSAPLVADTPVYLYEGPMRF